MSKDLVGNLLSLLELEQIEVNLFRGANVDTGQVRVFGGQVIAQSLMAASRTVDDRECHSLHGYFLRPGNPRLPILFEVDRIRDGKSFTTRRVVAIQNGEAIFNLACSYQVAEQGLEHQLKAPDVPGPEDCLSEEEMFAATMGTGSEMPEPIRRMMQDRPIEMRRAEPFSFANPVKRPPFQHVWFRTRGSLAGVDQKIQQAILAYASDMGILSTGTLPHGKSFLNGLMTASLDHAMWFHAPVNCEEWLLFAQESPAAAGSRGFNRGYMYNQRGELIASVSQEGLMREVQQTGS
ncbi:MAG: acyl-CoA thioesterase II [Pseudomonadales bacterium]|nr:acyl-CoA thioesterase II [Pseudomonadales bacterium]